MNNYNVLIASCTQKPYPDDTLLYQSLRQMSWDMSKVAWVTNNTQGLSKCYNTIFNKHCNNYDCIVYVHDDVFIDDAKLPEKLYAASHTLKYDIIGLAGTLNPAIKYPALWHIMGKREDHRGYAGHIANTGEKFMTGFGITPSRVAIADGLFIAVNTKPAMQAQWQWNENFDFHHYDIASCIDANNKKLKVGVYPINVFHNSPGLASLSDAKWLASNNKFLELYSQV